MGSVHCANGPLEKLFSWYLSIFTAVLANRCLGIGRKLRLYQKWLHLLMDSIKRLINRCFVDVHQTDRISENSHHLVACQLIVPSDAIHKPSPGLILTVLTGHHQNVRNVFENNIFYMRVTFPRDRWVMDLFTKAWWCIVWCIMICQWTGSLLVKVVACHQGLATSFD